MEGPVLELHHRGRAEAAEPVGEAVEIVLLLVVVVMLLTEQLRRREVIVGCGMKLLMMRRRRIVVERPRGILQLKVLPLLGLGLGLGLKLLLLLLLLPIRSGELLLLLHMEILGLLMDGVDNTDTTARIVTDSDHAHPKQEPADSPASASPTSSDMAAAVAAQPLVPGANAVQPGTGVNKRYRPAPAKTFQCRGFGDCRMVFSRSEHLARHIRCVLSASNICQWAVRNSTPGNTPASVRLPATAASSSRGSTISASMRRPCTPTSRRRTSA